MVVCWMETAVYILTLMKFMKAAQIGSGSLVLILFCNSLNDLPFHIPLWRAWPDFPVPPLQFSCLACFTNLADLTFQVLVIRFDGWLYSVNSGHVK